MKIMPFLYVTALLLPNCVHSMQKSSCLIPLEPRIDAFRSHSAMVATMPTPAFSREQSRVELPAFYTAAYSNKMRQLYEAIEHKNNERFDAVVSHILPNERLTDYSDPVVYALLHHNLHAFTTLLKAGLDLNAGYYLCDAHNTGSHKSLLSIALQAGNSQAVQYLFTQDNCSIEPSLIDFINTSFNQFSFPQKLAAKIIKEEFNTRQKNDIDIRYISTGIKRASSFDYNQPGPKKQATDQPTGTTEEPSLEKLYQSFAQFPRSAMNKNVALAYKPFFIPTTLATVKKSSDHPVTLPPILIPITKPHLQKIITRALSTKPETYALYHAIKTGNHDQLDNLLQNNANPYERLPNHSEPIVYALKNNNVPAFTRLLQAGLSIHDGYFDMGLNTMQDLLVHAFMCKSKKVVRFLLEEGVAIRSEFLELLTKNYHHWNDTQKEMVALIVQTHTQKGLPYKN